MGDNFLLGWHKLTEWEGTKVEIIGDRGYRESVWVESAHRKGKENSLPLHKITVSFTECGTAQDHLFHCKLSWVACIF